MGLSYRPDSIIGGPLDPAVIDQLERRKDILVKGSPLNTAQRTADDILFLESNAGWVRLTSAVDTLDYTTNEDTQKSKGQGSAELSKRNVLTGGTLSNGQQKQGLFSRNNAGYDKSNLYGFRPQAGITSFQVATKNDFGTLRTAEIGFKATSIEQLDELEQLFLRPGFSVLLEWGHSIYVTSGKVDDQGKLQKAGSGQIVKDPKVFIDFFTGKTRKELREQIQQLKKDSCYNYDAIYGIVKNFSWQIQPDQTYDCTVDVISEGELIESISMIVSPFEEKDDVAGEGKEKILDKNSTILHAFLFAIKGALYDNFLAGDEKFNILLQAFNLYTPSLWRQFYKSLEEKMGGEFRSVGFEPGILTETGSTYGERVALIPLSYILEAINIAISYKDQDGDSLVKFYTGNKEGRNLTPFITFDEHISIDPTKVMIKKGDNVDKLFRYPMESQLQVFGESNDLLNIFVSVDLLINLLDQVVENSTRGLTNTDITSYVKLVLKEISYHLGGVNQFDLHRDYDENLFYIVDRKVTPSEKSNLSTIDLVGLKSQLEQLNLQSQITANLTNIIAISAQAGNRNIGVDTLALQRWNKGLQDRHLVLRNTTEDDPTTTSQETPKVEIQKGELQHLLFHLDVVNRESTSTRFKYYGGNTKGLRSTHRLLMNQFVSYNTVKDGENPAGLIPFELSFAIKGIAGIKIGQAFKIPDEIIPKRYRGNIGFIVTGVDHSIEEGRWRTSIKSKMIVTGDVSKEFELVPYSLSEDIEALRNEISDERPPFALKYPFEGGQNSNKTRSDGKGIGSFGSTRQNRITGAVDLHKGWDILSPSQGASTTIRSGQIRTTNVYAPIDGVVSIVRGWSSDAEDAIAIKLTGLPGTQYEGYQVLLGFVSPSVPSGTVVSQGAKVGISEFDIAKRYKISGMTDHIYVQINKGSKVLNAQSGVTWIP